MIELKLQCKGPTQSVGHGSGNQTAAIPKSLAMNPLGIPSI